MKNHTLWLHVGRISSTNEVLLLLFVLCNLYWTPFLLIMSVFGHTTCLKQRDGTNHAVEKRHNKKEKQKCIFFFCAVAKFMIPDVLGQKVTFLCVCTKKCMLGGHCGVNQSPHHDRSVGQASPRLISARGHYHTADTGSVIIVAPAASHRTPPKCQKANWLCGRATRLGSARQNARCAYSI